ncbi:MAG: LON peptidase substrate-binding domain-containing protein, partial [Planctomycetota bacterium]
PFDDAWPPRACEMATATPVPVFPLPGAFLFPGQLMPLHIFEPRYRAMIEDSLDRSGRLVIGTVLEADRADLPQRPPIHPIAGVGEIARHEKLDDGRFLIWLVGLGRVRIEETESERPYRLVRVQPLAEVEASTAEVEELRPRILDAIRARTGSEFEVGEASLGSLSDMLVQCLTLPEAVLLDLHGELDVAERARKVLAAADRFPKRGG